MTITAFTVSTLIFWLACQFLMYTGFLTLACQAIIQRCRFLLVDPPKKGHPLVAAFPAWWNAFHERSVVKSSLGALYDFFLETKPGAQYGDPKTQSFFYKNESFPVDSAGALYVFGRWFRQFRESQGIVSVTNWSPEVSLLTVIFNSVVILMDRSPVDGASPK